jgi:hypothetical protein
MKTRMAEGERLQRAISEREFPTSRLSADLRAAATSYARRRVSEGASQGAISEELGVSTFSVGRWLRADESPEFVPAHIVADATEASQRFEVITPRGLRVVGLDIGALCALLDRPRTLRVRLRVRRARRHAKILRVLSRHAANEQAARSPCERARHSLRGAAPTKRVGVGARHVNFAGKRSVEPAPPGASKCAPLNAESMQAVTAGGSSSTSVASVAVTDPSGAICRMIVAHPSAARSAARATA